MLVNPSRDVLENKFAELFSGNVSSPEFPHGTDIIFQKEDVYTVSDPLAQLLRYILADKRVTYTYLFDMYKNYAINTMGALPSDVTRGKGNLKDTIHRTPLSFRKLYEILVLILGYEVDFMLSVNDGRSHKTYRRTDVTL